MTSNERELIANLPPTTHETAPKNGEIDMLASIGIATVAVIVAALTFYAAVRLIDHWGWWNEAGLAAFIPMFATATPIAIAAASLAVWLIK